MTEELVLLDTNFLMVPHQFGVDIFEELDRLLLSDYKLIVLSTQEEELGSVAKKAGGKDKVAAHVALELIKRAEVVPSTKGLEGDDAIVDFASKNDCIVCTNDSNLRRRLTQSGTRTICMKGKQKLGFC